MLKKFFVAGAVALTAFVGSQFNFCGASIPRSQMFLGSLTVGSTVDEMKKIYGEPTENRHVIEGNNIAIYGKGVKIDYFSFGKGNILGIDITANNGWKTPAGIGVGDNISKVLEVYGQPDYSKSNSIKTAYAYYPDGYRENQSSPGLFIVFNKSNNKILEMYLDNGGGGDRMADPEPVIKRVSYFLNKFVE